MKTSDYVTSLFFGGVYYWLTGEEATADMLWRTAVDILNMQVSTIGEA
jgi:hypothetical protein